jgi:phosphatidylinositol-3-phosphatase
VADRKDDQNPGPTGPSGGDVAGRGRGACTECGTPLAPDQRYCLNCGHRRGQLPGAVAGTVGALISSGKGLAAGAAAKAPKPKDGEDGWSWMPSPQAIAIAVIGMLALGVGLGSAMSEIANSAPLQTILLKYPRHAEEGSPAEEPEEEAAEEPKEEEVVAESSEETVVPEEIATLPLAPEETPEFPVEGEEGGEEETALQKSIRESEEEQAELAQEEAEEALPEVKHAWLIVLGENSYESIFGATAAAPYLTRTLPKKGLLIPHYYGVTAGVLANEIALLSGQGPTLETAANCPDYTAITPATVAATAGQIEGVGCAYPNTVASLPTELEEDELEWRAYVEGMEDGGAIGAPWRCRRPTVGVPDPPASSGDQYLNWRNPVVYFDAIAASETCEKHDVGFEVLTKDLKAKKKTPALSLIFPDACHMGGEVACEPGAPTGAVGAAQLLKTLIPAIMHSPAYEEGGGLIMITSAQAPQAGPAPDPSACCLAPTYPNLPLVAGAIAPGTTTTATTGTATTESSATEAEEEASTRYTEESVLAGGGGGKVGLLLISPLVLAGSVEEREYANHFTLLKTLTTMFGVEPLGYAAEGELPMLSPELFIKEESKEEEEAKKAALKEAEGGA